MRERPFFLEEIPQFTLPFVGLAVLGHPISHSISPVLHNAALSDLSLQDSAFKGWSYHRVDIKAENLANALVKFAEAGYLGLNLTIPHKVEVLKSVNRLDSEASLIGAVNTLFLRDGQWFGYNTDGYGLHQALRKDLGVYIPNSRILILGAGGAARAAAVKCLLEGASSVHIHNRSPERLNDLLSLLRNHFERSRISGSTVGNFREFEFVDQDWVVINATSLGLSEEDPSPFCMPCTELGKKSVVYDMIYNPAKTKLLAEADEAGLSFANGLSMLVYQAAKALEIWTDQEVCAKRMLEAAKNYFSG